MGKLAAARGVGLVDACITGGQAGARQGTLTYMVGGTAADLERLRPHLHAVVFDYKMPLYEVYKPILNIYFPISGVASLVNTVADGSSVEVGTIGNEGMVGVPVVLGDEAGEA